MSEPTIPEGLGKAGVTLWNSLHEEIEFGAHELRMVEDACRVADVIARLDEASLNSELVVKGSTGQPVISPTIAEARNQRSLLANLLSKLKVPMSEEKEQKQALSRSEQARKAANARWGND